MSDPIWRRWKECVLSQHDSSLEALVRAAQSGDSVARTDLVERFRPLFFSLARSSGDDLEDVLQEAVLQFLQLVDEYRPGDGVYFGRYIKEKLRWRIANYRRILRQTYDRSVPLNDNTSIEFAGIDRVLIRDLLDHLPARQRNLMILMYWHEEKTEGIAQSWGISSRAVRKIRQRAERRIRRMLQSA